MGDVRPAALGFGRAFPVPLLPLSRAFFSAHSCDGVLPPSSAKVRLAVPTGALGATGFAE